MKELIIGFSVKSISAERKVFPKGRIDINSVPSIISVKKSKMSFLKKDQPLNVEFEFTTKYEPEIAEIKIKGNVLYFGKNMKSTIEKWEKEKKFPFDVEAEIKNFLFRKCLTIGINLSENMQLPPPLLFPQVLKKEKDLRYIG